MPSLDLQEGFLLQIFADDISVAIKGRDGVQVLQMARILAEVLQDTLAEMGLGLSHLECKNFLIEGGKGALQLF